MELRRSLIPGSSSSMSGFNDKDTRLQLHHSNILPTSHSFKEPIQPADFDSGRHLISKRIQTVTTTEDGQQIIEEERLTRLNNTIFALSDMRPGQSLSMGKDGTLVLKESSMKIDFHLQ